MLDTAANSFRHTTWRVYGLAPAEWAAVTSHAPSGFKCVLTLIDASAKPVESDYYPLHRFGVLKLNYPNRLVLSPFVVVSDDEYYIPEVTLTKSVVVLRDDVPRVKDFTATIEEGPPYVRP